MYNRFPGHKAKAGDLGVCDAGQMASAFLDLSLLTTKSRIDCNGLKELLKLYFKVFLYSENKSSITITMYLKNQTSQMYW